METEEYKEIIEKLKYKIYDQKRKIEDLQNELSSEKEKRYHCEFLIKTELNPRIKREEAAYDAYVKTDHAEEASESFVDKLDSIIEMVEESPNYFVWGNKDGDIYEMVLMLIGLHVSDKLDKYHIEQMV